MTITKTISTLAVDTTLIDAADVTTPLNELLQIFNDYFNGAQDAEATRYIEITTPSTPAATKWKFYFKAAGPYYLDDAGTELPFVSTPSQPCQARLTLTTALAVTTADVTAATNVYVTPYGGNRISLYDGSANWTVYSFTEITNSLTGLAADKNYDVFCYLSAGSVVSELVVWTSDSARATALALQDGVYVKSGTTTKRYIGTIRTTATIGQCEDSISKRYVWNYYNRVVRQLSVIELTDSWTYATTTWRPWNNNSANRVSFVIGVAEGSVKCDFLANASEAGAVVCAAAIGLDSTSVPSGLISRHTQTTIQGIYSSYQGVPAAGFHFLQMLEFAGGATVTFYGDSGTVNLQSGAYGTLAA